MLCVHIFSLWGFAHGNVSVEVDGGNYHYDIVIAALCMQIEFRSEHFGNLYCRRESSLAYGNVPGTDAADNIAGLLSIRRSAFCWNSLSSNLWPRISA